MDNFATHILAAAIGIVLYDLGKTLCPIISEALYKLFKKFLEILDLNKI